MTLREVLKKVVSLLGLEDEVSLDDEMVTGDVAKRLLLAGNNIIRELASSYMPLVERESVTIVDGRLDLSSLKRRAIRVIRLMRGHISIPFKMYPTYMYADNGVYDVEYTYLPSEVGLDEMIECDSRINEDILSSGIASEYSFMTGNVEMATVYDRKYRESIKNLAVTRREIRIKGRLFR